MKKRADSNFSKEEEWEYNKQKAKFSEYYRNEIIPVLLPQEEIRRKYVGRFWFLITIALFVLPILGGIFYFLGKYLENDFGWVIFLSLCILFVYLIRSLFVKYHKRVKNNSMEVFISFFNGFGYRYGQSLNRVLMEKSLIFPQHDVLTAGEGFYGRYNDIGITVSEQSLYKRHKEEKGKTVERNIFKGIAMELDMKRNFSSQIIGLQDKGLLDNLRKYSDMEKIRTGEALYDTEFDLYGTKQAEAKQVLTPNFMDRIISLKKVYKGKTIQVSFYANKVLVSIYTQEDIIEDGSFFRSYLSEKKFLKAFDKVWSIFLVANILKQDQEANK